MCSNTDHTIPYIHVHVHVHVCTDVYLHSVVVVLAEQLQEPEQRGHALQLWRAHHAGPGHHVDRVPLLGRDGRPAAGSGALLIGHRSNDIELLLSMIIY